MPYHVSFWTFEIYIRSAYAMEGAIEPASWEDIACTVSKVLYCRERERERMYAIELVDIAKVGFAIWEDATVMTSQQVKVRGPEISPPTSSLS